MTQSSPRTISVSPVVSGLQQVLADSYALMSLTHHAHWNVQGSDFFQLHAAFQAQYENLFEAVDELAERMRVLGSFPVGGLMIVAKQAGLGELPLAAPAKEFVADLVAAHEKTVADLLTLRESSAAAMDLETQDLVIGRLQWHGKALWMLNSYLA